MKHMRRRGVLREAPRRMLNLQPLIARFVDDVLRALRSASLEDLRDRLAPERKPPQRPGRRQAPIGPVEPTRAPAAPRRITRRPSAPSTGREPARVAPSEPTTLAVTRAEPVPEPPVDAEITDPAALLAGATPAQGAPPAPPEQDPPPSAARPTASPAAALREGESLARTTGAGLVIRRPKRG